MARSAGLEPATSGLENRCSIQLSYERFFTRLYATPEHLGQTDAGCSFSNLCLHLLHGIRYKR